MLNANSSRLAHAIRDLALIALSISLLPLSTLILLLSYQILYFRRGSDVCHRTSARADPNFKPRVVLVTGVGMTKGLALARLFYQAGHVVIGADFEPGGALVCGRGSKVLQKFYRLRAPTSGAGSEPYLESLLNIVLKEQVDLWVSCSGVASAVEDGEAKEVIEAKTKCKAIQFDIKTTQMLHEKHSFIERTKELGLTVPETHEVTSRAKVEEVLRNAPKGRRYIMKTIGVDDSARGDMTLLPKANQQETSTHIARLAIGHQSPWIIQQFIEGHEYCTHALVIRGQVQAFVACPSAELLMYYQALPANAPLSKAMLAFTTTFAEKSGVEFTGHLSFDFLVQSEDLTKDKIDEITLYPIECNPRAHTAVALFNGTSKMADAYMNVFASRSDRGALCSSPVIPTRKDKYYWTGHDLVAAFLIPTLNLIMFRTSLHSYISQLDLLIDRLLTWKDGTYEVWDPLPWWWLYHVYWPLRLFNMLVQGRKWSRVNVSTCKVFEC